MSESLNRREKEMEEMAKMHQLYGISILSYGRKNLSILFQVTENDEDASIIWNFIAKKLPVCPFSYGIQISFK